MRTLVLFSAVLAVVVGLKCYTGTYGKGKAPTSGSPTINICTNSCIKSVNSVNGAQVSAYGCGDSTCDTLGISNGKCSKQKAGGASVNSCCCTGDLCNSSGLAQISAVVVLILSALVM